MCLIIHFSLAYFDIRSKHKQRHFTAWTLKKAWEVNRGGGVFVWNGGFLLERRGSVDCWSHQSVTLAVCSFCLFEPSFSFCSSTLALPRPVLQPDFHVVDGCEGRVMFQTGSLTRSPSRCLPYWKKKTNKKTPPDSIPNLFKLLSSDTVTFEHKQSETSTLIA